MCLEGGEASLRKMKIDQCLNFVELPNDLHILKALKELRISICPNLFKIPFQSGGFTSLVALQIKACGVINFPIQMIESCASSLESLDIGRLWILTNLKQVISILSKMQRLRMLGIDVPEFSDVAAEIGCLHRLEFLSIWAAIDCCDYDSFTASLERILPLPRLLLLDIAGMEEWNALPDQLRRLTTLPSLRLIEFGIETLPEWLENLASLKYLCLVNCQKLRRLPSKKALTNLTRLDIYGCPLLKQNLDEEWSKISHIPTIEVDGTLISAPAH